MRACGTVRLYVPALIGFLASVGLRANQSEIQDECTRSAHLRIFSNAAFIEEAGDVIGYELAFQPPDGKSVKAKLYVYQGTPNLEGISVSGKSYDGSVTMEGSWILHLIEEPSKKEIVETRPVKISGTLDSNRFRGTIKVSGQAETVTMKRTDHIWMCGANRVAEAPHNSPNHN